MPLSRLSHHRAALHSMGEGHIASEQAKRDLVGWIGTRLEPRCRAMADDSARESLDEIGAGDSIDEGRHDMGMDLIRRTAGYHDGTTIRLV